MKNYLILLLSILFLSCQKKENINAPLKTSTPNNMEKTIETIPEENKQIGDTIFLTFKDDKSQYTAEGSVDSIQPRVYLKFTNEVPGELTGKITTPAGGGNIRFNQIIFPDKNSDGPFGIDIKTKLEQKGKYILVIGHSQMADNPYWGKFKVQLQNKIK